ncbi:MAG TPA: thiamine phosphate synthase [Crocinitomicaceae bacterium]|nr:thiamine phosphate synthase [Crocinitomicaceae bacterium]
MKNNIYYISQGATSDLHCRNIKQVCKIIMDNAHYNLSYVQLRLKDVSDKEYLATAKEALEICNFFNVKLIINDNLFVANEIACFGIHVGKNDESPISIRKKITGNKIIGGTANTLEDCLELIKQEVDYIGLGPFKHTTTKKILSPILGMEGYQFILTELKKRNLNTPIYAIGGVELEDIDPLINLGFHGVAISSALTKATSLESEDAKHTGKNERILNF